MKLKMSFPLQKAGKMPSLLFLTMASLLLVQCHTEELFTEDPSSETAQADFTQISIDHPLAQKVFLALEGRMDQVNKAAEHGSALGIGLP